MRKNLFVLVVAGKGDLLEDGLRRRRRLAAFGIGAGGLSGGRELHFGKGGASIVVAELQQAPRRAHVLLGLWLLLLVVVLSLLERDGVLDLGVGRRREAPRSLANPTELLLRPIPLHRGGPKALPTLPRRLLLAFLVLAFTLTPLELISRARLVEVVRIDIVLVDIVVDRLSCRKVEFDQSFVAALANLGGIAADVAEAGAVGGGVRVGDLLAEVATCQ